LEGLKTALDWLDAVIELIRAARNPEEAKQGLMAGNFSDPKFLKKLGLPEEQRRFAVTVQLSEKQAQAILEMRLQRLTGLERDKILAEYADIQRLIIRLKEILASEAELLNIIVTELRELKEKFGDERRTQIVDQTGEITLEDTIVEERHGGDHLPHRLHQAHGRLAVPLPAPWRQRGRPA